MLQNGTRGRARRHVGRTSVVSTLSGLVIPPCPMERSQSRPFSRKCASATGLTRRSRFMSSHAVNNTKPIQRFRKRGTLLVLGCFLLLTQQSGQADQTNPLGFFKNYFVTGNYVS